MINIASVAGVNTCIVILVITQKWKFNINILIMKAEEFVGKWIVSEVLTDEINAPAGTAFKVVGYVPDTDLVIVDAEHWGWKGLMPGMVTSKECETYKYVRLDDITEVL